MSGAAIWRGVNMAAAFFYTEPSENRHSGEDRSSEYRMPNQARHDEKGDGCFRSALQSQKGLTLVEVLVAVAILSVGLAAVASMQKTAMMVNMRAFDITEAATLAQSRLEFILSLPYSNDINAQCQNDGPCETVEPFRATQGFPGIDPGYICRCTIGAPADASAAGAKIVTVVVSANNGGSSAPDYTIRGVKSAPPP